MTNMYSLSSEDEWYTSEEPIREMIETILIPSLPLGSTIWCPFDTDESNFPKLLKEAGYKVISTHIDNGFDFLTKKPEFAFDAIISNPPFKNKKAFIERCESFNKPWLLLFGSAICYQNGMANVLNSHYKYFIYKPVKFYNNDKTKRFLCLWLGTNNFWRTKSND